jgi:hypothetical protein
MKAGRTARQPREAHDDDGLRTQLERRLKAHLPAGARLAVTVTDNRYTMISVKRESGLYRVRLHRMFLQVDSAQARVLARYIVDNDAEASTALGHFIDANQHAIRRAKPVRRLAVPIETLGRYFDLQEIYDDLNRRLFLGAIDAKITWGQRSSKRIRRNSIKMGSYSVEDRLVRIHPSLDRDFVPRYFVEWIVFHEMLHQVHDIPTVNGRRLFHSPEFLAQERSFEHYQRAREWERRNLNKLLLF